MNLGKLRVAVGLFGVLVSPVAWSQPPQAEPTPPQAPKNVTAEPSTAESRQLATQAADAQIGGDPQAALALAERAIAADPQDPWGHYNKAAALSRLRRTDEAVQSFAAAEERFAPSNLWARSVAIYGSAHALAEAGRCDEARSEYVRYSSFVRERDPKSATLAAQYAATCRGPATPQSSPPAPAP